MWTAKENSVGREAEPISVTLADGSFVRGLSWQTTPLDVAKSLSPRLARSSVAAFVQPASGGASSSSSAAAARSLAVAGSMWDLTRPLEEDCTLELVGFDDPRGQQVFWHSSAHVLGCAMEQRFGGLLTVGPAVRDGFFYDMFLGGRQLSEEAITDLAADVRTLRDQSVPFQRMSVSRADALELFSDNPFKAALIEGKVSPQGRATVYRCGPFVDLCRGPHLPSTAHVKAFALTGNSSAYWHGSAENDSLQRVYGVSFPSEKLLKEHQAALELARERDHRRIGSQQDLFFFDGVHSPGSCFWTPHGTRIYNKIQELMRAEYRKRGYEEVITPNIFTGELFKISGHSQNYMENMFGFKTEGQEWYLKPMNCPGHCLMFASRPRSYRELPLRLASFGVLHRNEMSGTLSGLTRVRRFQQDDAHVFCRDDQIRTEVAACLEFVFDVYALFGFEFTLTLSTRPMGALGSADLWDRAESQLEQALNESGREWSTEAGDGAFYGPKIDIRLQDALGRQHQCGTVQLDFQLPLRFNLRYQAPVGAADRASSASASAVDPKVSADEVHVCAAEAGGSALPPGYGRPVIVHRAILGSVERMVGILCEHFGGRWPFWMSPRQCMVVPVSDQTAEYARYVRDSLAERGLHAEVDLGSDRLNKKVRAAQLAQFNYILVVGDKEEATVTVNLRARGETKPLGERDLAQLVDELESESLPLALSRPKALRPFARRPPSTPPPDGGG